MLHVLSHLLQDPEDRPTIWNETLLIAKLEFQNWKLARHIINPHISVATIVV